MLIACVLQIRYMCLVCCQSHLRCNSSDNMPRVCLELLHDLGVWKWILPDNEFSHPLNDLLLRVSLGIETRESLRDFGCNLFLHVPSSERCGPASPQYCVPRGIPTTCPWEMFRRRVSRLESVCLFHPVHVS